MAYRRGGVFRSRQIAPPSQRASVALSKPAITQATLVFDGAAHGSGSVLDNGVLTLGPLTADPAVGKERLVLVGGLSLSASTIGGDFKACTIDGQAATRVATVSRAFPASGAYSTFMTAYRAPGTANTSISVSVTVGSLVPDSTVIDAYAACFKLSYAGALRASAASAVNDPTLNLNTATSGTAVAGLYGYVGIGSASVPVFRAEAHSTYGANDPSTTVSKPTGTVDGDIMLAGMFIFRASSDLAEMNITAPAGWTQIGTNTELTAPDTFYSGKFFLFWKRAASEGASYTFTHSGSVTSYSTQICIAAYSGCVASGDPVDVFSQNKADASSTATGTSVTTSSANTKLVYIGNNYDGTATLTPPTGMTERFDGVAYVADEDVVLPGATGDRVQLLASWNPWSAFLVALKPAAGGATASTAVWSGLTERFDADTFSVASADTLAASTPLAVAADLTPDLIASTTSVASLSLSFLPVPTRTLSAIAGSYALSGANPGTFMGRRVIATTAASYAITGTPASLGNVKKLTVTAGGYLLSGSNAGLNPGAGATASIVFEATDTDTADLASGTYTFPLTVAAASGERLVIVGGIAGTDGDFSAVTVDGQAGTRVGFVSRGVADSSGYTPFLTAFRAPSTASTSINVVATIGGSLKTQTSAYCAGFHMTGMGAVYATTNSSSNDPTLSTDVVNNGAAVAALLGYADTTPTATWSGLTECFDLSLGTDVFSGASVNISGASVPAFRSEAHTAYGPVFDVIVNKPTGVVANDILIAVIFYANPPPPTDLVPPAGWTQIGTTATPTEVGFSGKCSIWWLRAGASEPSSYTFALWESCSAQGMIAAYSGCATSDNAIDAFSQNSANSGSVATATAITTTVGSTKLIYAGNNWTGDGALTAPSGMTERFDGVVYLADRDFTGPGTTGDLTQTLTVSGFPWTAFAIALKPAMSPRPIAANITPNLTDVGSDSVASLCISFLPSGAASNTTIAAPAAYTMTGTPALTAYGRRAAVTTVGSYAMTGTPATMRSTGQITAQRGSYAMTGQPAATIKSGANKVIDATTSGVYALTGKVATLKRGTKLVVTTVGSYSLVGTSPVTTGMGLIALAGSYAMTGTPASLVYRAGPNVSISVGSTPMTASSGTASVRTTVGVLVSGVGNFATVSVGNPSIAVTGGITVFASGTSATAFVGNATVSIGGGIEVSVTGNEMAASSGTVTVVIPARVTVTGNPMTASVGSATVNVLGSVNEMIIGNQLDASVGTVSFLTNANVSVTGNEMAASVGSVDALALAGVTVTGNEMTASVGDVTVSAKQNTVVNVDGLGMQSYVGILDFAGGGTITHPNLKNREGRMLQPSNFMGG